MNLWPFRKRGPAPKSAKVQLVERLRAWRPIGSTFEYLGRRCVVTSHWRLEGWGNEFAPRSVVGIQADYTDDLGVLRNITFSAAESIALMEGAPPTASEDGLHDALCFLGELESAGNTKAGDIARGLRRLAATSKNTPKVTLEMVCEAEAHYPFALEREPTRHPRWAWFADFYNRALAAPGKPCQCCNVTPDGDVMDHLPPPPSRSTQGK